MKLIDVQKKLITLKQSLLQTVDVAACLNISLQHASKILERLEEAEIIKKVMRGKWMLTTVVDPLLLPEFITFPMPSYISLHTALYYHGLISQIPDTTYAVSLARTQQVKTPLGVISIHHIQSQFFFGYETYKNTFIKLAIPEKALLDVLYLADTRSLLFKKLPEIEIPETFNKKLALSMIDKIASLRLKTLVKERLIKLF